MELPQLRQMVLDNTQRIEKNELMINEMRMKRREGEQTQRERETYWDVARDEHDRAHREHERDMRELRKILHEHSVSFDAAMKRSDEQREKWHQEFDESLRKSREEDEERQRRFEERLKESDEKREKWHQEFDESLRKSREEDEERQRRFEERLKESDEKREKWHQEFDESLRKSREEREEWHRKFEEDLKKSSEKFEEDLKKSREDFDRRMKESDENLKKQREEDRIKMEELDKSVKRATEAVSNLARQVSSVTGNIVEGLLGPASRKMFIDAGYPISRCCKRVQIGDKDTRQTAMEIDVMEYGETMVIAVEVKADCEKKDIRKILKKMVRFKELCPEHADKEVLAGVASVNFEEGAYELAKESGLVIIHVKEESVFELEPEFTLDPVPDKSVLRRF